MQYCIEIGNTNFQKTKTEKRKDNNTHLSSLKTQKLKNICSLKTEKRKDNTAHLSSLSLSKNSKTEKRNVFVVILL